MTTTTTGLEGLEHPELSARTRRFQLGRPRGYQVLPEHQLVLFLRSSGPLDPILSLWALDLDTGEERLLVDPARLDDGDASGAGLPAEELARRERAREAAGGIVAYSVSRAAGVVAFTHAGELYRLDVTTGDVARQPVGVGAYDPQVDPTGRRIAYVRGGGLHVVAPDAEPHQIAGDDDPDVTWGVADFVAAEEMGRQSGYWWSPDGERLLVARVDNRPVATWHIADAANPGQPPRAHRYPAAGTANAEVSLALFEVAGGGRADVTWDLEELPYLAAVRWTSAGPPLLVLQSRDQRRLVTLALDEVSGATRIVDAQQAEPWLEVPVGAPCWLPDGRLLTMFEDLDAGIWGTRRLAIDGVAVTPAGLQVASVVAVDAEGVVFHGHEEPTEAHVHRLVLPSAPEQAPHVVTLTDEVGMHHAVASGQHLVVTSLHDDRSDVRVEVRRGDDVVGTIESRHASPGRLPSVRHLRLGPDELRVALLLPSDDDGSSPLPVIMDPYGGPHAQRVVRSALAHAQSQWLADQGFAVVVCDGRGTPSRGPRWEHRIHGDLATGVLADQVTALHEAAALEPRLDLQRVGIRGWSFGGFLAALAVLRRPDVFSAAVAGAPVTDWRLYDTHYTERYLGHPDAEPVAHRASSLVDEHGLVDAAPWSTERPPRLQIIHGLADDNVVAAHSLRLSAALLAAGRPHEFLPLSGVTHMTPQVVVAANLARLELAFLQRSLGVAPRSEADRAPASDG